MSLSRLAAKNIFLLLITRGIIVCISIIVIAKTSRYLGVEGFGEYNLVFTYLGFFTLLTDLGMSTIVIREMSANREKAGSILFNYILLRTILIAIAITSLFLSISFLTYPDSTKKLIMLASIAPIAGILTPFELTFHITQKFKYSSFITIFIRVVSAILILLLVFFKARVEWLISVSILDNIINSILAFYLGKKLVKIIPRIDFSLCRFIIVKSWPLAVSTITWMIYTRIDHLLIAHFKGNIGVGYYTASLKLIEQFIMLPVFIVTVIFPLLSQLRSHAIDRFVRISNLTFKYMAMTAVFLGVILSSLSDTLIIFIYGRDFLPAQNPFIWLTWAQMFRFPNIILEMLININDRQKSGMLNSILCTLVSFSVNMYLIPRLGVSGAAFTAFFSGLIMFFLSVRIVKKDFPELNLSPILGFLIAGTSGWFFIDRISGGLITGLLVFPLIYFGVILLFKGFNKDDFHLFKEIVIFKKGELGVL